MYVLDSNILIELLNEGPLCSKICKFLSGEPAITTSICLHEVLSGTITEQQKLAFEKTFQKIRILDHSASAARIGSRYEQELRRNGTMINRFDLLIAGVCTAHQGTLVTMDADFKKIPKFSHVIVG